MHPHADTPADARPIAPQSPNADLQAGDATWGCKSALPFLRWEGLSDKHDELGAPPRPFAAKT